MAAAGRIECARALSRAQYDWQAGERRTGRKNCSEATQRHDRAREASQRREEVGRRRIQREGARTGASARQLRHAASYRYCTSRIS